MNAWEKEKYIKTGWKTKHKKYVIKHSDFMELSGNTLWTYLDGLIQEWLSRHCEYEWEDIEASVSIKLDITYNEYDKRG